MQLLHQEVLLEFELILILLSFAWAVALQDLFDGMGVPSMLEMRCDIHCPFPVTGNFQLVNKTLLDVHSLSAVQNAWTLVICDIMLIRRAAACIRAEGLHPEK